LNSNFIVLASRENWVLYQYRVEIFTVNKSNENKDELENRRLRMGLMKSHRPLFNNQIAYDGASTLYSIVKLPEKVKSFTCTHHQITY
jgi:hypothetical protein